MSSKAKDLPDRLKDSLADDDLLGMAINAEILSWVFAAVGVLGAIVFFIGPDIDLVVRLWCIPVSAAALLVAKRERRVRKILRLLWSEHEADI